MTDQEITAAVQAIVAAIPQGKPPTAQDSAAIAAGVALATNFLQNINAIAQASKPA